MHPLTKKGVVGAPDEQEGRVVLVFATVVSSTPPWRCPSIDVDVETPPCGAVVTVPPGMGTLTVVGTAAVVDGGGWLVVPVVVLPAPHAANPVSVPATTISLH
jgi:hypothetical protein